MKERGRSLAKKKGRQEGRVERGVEKSRRKVGEGRQRGE